MIIGELIQLSDNQQIDFLISWNGGNGPCSMGIRKPENDLVIVKNGDRSRGILLNGISLDEIIAARGL